MLVSHCRVDLIEDLHIIQTKQNIFKQLSKTGIGLAVIRVVLEVHNHRNSQKIKEPVSYVLYHASKI
jgi:hypothetical protein